MSFELAAGALLGTLGLFPATAEIIRVPADQPTIQQGIDVASARDTVLVAPGTYVENISVSGKSVTLASKFAHTRDIRDVRRTIIDGSGGTAVISLRSTTEKHMLIEGFTIRNGLDGISVNSGVRLTHCVIQRCGDGIDFQTGGHGLCAENIFELNTDDGIDLDGSARVKAIGNLIRDNDDDGIEIRLHPYAGELLLTQISWNTIIGNGEDGIQLIDYPDTTDRAFLIERNVITDNDMAGLGCMSNGNSNESYEGASIPEPIYFIHNIVDGNEYGVTGGDQMIAANNIIINNATLGMKNIDGASIVTHSAFWKNGQDLEQCNTRASTLIFSNPGIDSTYRLVEDSPCIDAGHPRAKPDPDNSNADIGVYFFDQGTPPGS